MKSKRSKLCIVYVSNDVILEKNNDYTRWKKFPIKKCISFSTTGKGKKGLNIVDVPLKFKRFIYLNR